MIDLRLDLSNPDVVRTRLENAHEKYYIELKKASDLPRDFWPTYSAFSNTEGGWIALGVVEGEPLNELVGVPNVDRITTQLWNHLSNPQKASYRTIDNSDVYVFSFGNQSVILVRVHEAPDNKKPVYINGRLEEAYIRTGDGDRKATESELQSFLRNASPGQDSLVADSFTFSDLDEDSVLSFKERVSKRFPKKNFMKMKNEEFLTEIGAAIIARNTGSWMLKKGTLLFLGKVNSIKELFPNYHLDYFNRRGGNERWRDRVSDDEPGEYEMNLYNFYMIVYEKLRNLLQEAFVLDSEQMRLPASDFDETIRECLVNCLAHADYIQGYPSTKIEAYDGWFYFVNPGKMLVSPQQFINGGDSRPRNEVVMKLFRLLGASERQGFGGPLIYKSALRNKYRNPEIQTNIERTELRVWNIDLPDSYPNLTEIEKNTLRLIIKLSKPLSINKICELSGKTDYQVRKAISSLVSANLLVKLGNGPSTKYFLPLTSTEMVAQFELALEGLKKKMTTF